MASPSDGVDASQDGVAWGRRDDAALVATVLLAAVSPPVVAGASGRATAVWALFGVVVAAVAVRRRRTGRLAGVRSVGGKRFLYGCLAFYVSVGVLSVVVSVLAAPGWRTSPTVLVTVLGAGGVAGLGAWRLSCSGER